jgi:hypothetical protein
MHISSLKRFSLALFMGAIIVVFCFDGLGGLLGLPVASAADRFEQDPVNYGKQKTDDPIARLQKRINKGEVQLEFDKDHGYLPAVLKHLGISTKSQVLVFSKTSFQQPRISPFMPRSIYFNDANYIGDVQGGEVVEITSVDPQQGAIFYALEQNEVKKPKFVRMTDRCLQCHASSLTQGVPGHLVRSVFTDPKGFPVFRAGTFRTDHTSEFSKRWGGWYVSGTHGKQRHMGNVLIGDMEQPDQLDTDAGANKTDLSKLVNVEPYLTPHSDIVALMVMEHQSTMHNMITNANFEARYALHYAEAINKALERPMGYRSPSTMRRIHHAADRLLKYMLFSEEAKLTGVVKGTSGYAEHFSKTGPRDKKGRSLRDFDMTTRMFKYPCSYLVYSEAFDGLPDVTRRYIYARLWEILTGKKPPHDPMTVASESDETQKRIRADDPDPFAHLSKADRQAIFEILRDTKKGLPDYWKAPGS